MCYAGLPMNKAKAEKSKPAAPPKEAPPDGGWRETVESIAMAVILALLFRGFDELYVGLIVCGALAAGFSLSDPANVIAGRRLWNPMQLWLVAMVVLSVVELP